jgi:hypothetical protein
VFSGPRRGRIDLRQAAQRASRGAGIGQREGGRRLAEREGHRRGVFGEVHVGAVDRDRDGGRRVGQEAEDAEALSFVIPDDLAQIIDAVNRCGGAAWQIDNRVGAATVYEAMALAAAVLVGSDDLAQIVDAVSHCGGTAWRIDHRVGAATVNEAVVLAAAVMVISDDLAQIVDPVRIFVIRLGTGVSRQIEGGINAAAVKEAVAAGSILVRSDDLSRGVDAVR